MKVNIWIILSVIAVLAIVFYFLYKDKSSLLPNVIVNKLPASNTVIINKRPGEQWTREELKAQGYSDTQIDAASQTASNIALNFLG